MKTYNMSGKITQIKGEDDGLNLYSVRVNETRDKTDGYVIDGFYVFFSTKDVLTINSYVGVTIRVGE